MVFTGTGNIDVVFHFLGLYVFGSPQAVGLFLLTFLFMGAMMLRVDFVIALVLLIPVNVILVANGDLSLLVGGLHIMLVFIVFAIAFFKSKK